MVEPPQDATDLVLTESRLTTGGSVTAKPSIYHDKVRKRGVLRKAWRVVFENGETSRCEETRKQVREFSRDADRRIDRIARQLQARCFKFAPSRGILGERPGKEPRPIVSSPIPSRIVQRAILDVLQEEPALAQFYRIPTSFGGIAGRGVPGAIEAACRAIAGGASYFITSDIVGFFATIPRETVLEKIAAVIHDRDFNRLLETATHTELENLDRLGKGAAYFPTYEIGVAQGCSLSALLGNILLEEFDREMNGHGIVCLRYIDDFLLLGQSETQVRKAFQSAQRRLQAYRLSAYEPGAHASKAKMGETKNGIEFLGCEIRPGLIRPNKKAKKRLLKHLDETLEASRRAMSHPEVIRRRKLSVTETLRTVDNVIRGWGDQYSFCNDTLILDWLNGEIDKRIHSYMSAYLFALRREEGRRD